MTKIPFITLIGCRAFRKSLSVSHALPSSAEQVGLTANTACSSSLTPPDQKTSKTPFFGQNQVFNSQQQPEEEPTVSSMVSSPLPPSLLGTAMEQVTQPGETESLRPGVLPAHLAWEGERGTEGGIHSQALCTQGRGEGRCLLFSN